MPTLFSYPGLYGVADNNPYGLKVFAFLKLSGRIKSNPLMLPAHNALNLGALVVFGPDP